MDAVFKNDLHISALQSIIKLQADQITELKRDKELYRRYYHELADKQPTEVITLPPPIDPNSEDWKPLREAIELPSARRERLQKKYRDIAKEAKKKEMEKV